MKALLLVTIMFGLLFHKLQRPSIAFLVHVIINVLRILFSRPILPMVPRARSPGLLMCKAKISIVSYMWHVLNEVQK